MSTTTATTSSMCISPPVLAPAKPKPSAHNTNRITIIVQSIIYTPLLQPLDLSLFAARTAAVAGDLSYVLLRCFAAVVAAKFLIRPDRAVTYIVFTFSIVRHNIYFLYLTISITSPVRVLPELEPSH